METSRRDDDPYWQEQWERSEEALNKREKARRDAWPKWEKEQISRSYYSPWLVVPCHATDDGAAPRPATYWASPFIWIESPDSSGMTLAGAENHVAAVVFNLGAATAAPTRVDFFWADPSVGLGAADFHWIGTESVEVQPMSSKVVRCATPWIPTFLNGGHECVLVNCDNHVLDPILAPFQPWADRHVGQCNFAVLPAVTQAFKLWAPTGPLGAVAELRITALRGIMRAALSGRQAFGHDLRAAVSRLIAGLQPQAISARTL